VPIGNKSFVPADDRIFAARVTRSSSPPGVSSVATLSRSEASRTRTCRGTRNVSCVFTCGVSLATQRFLDTWRSAALHAMLWPTFREACASCHEPIVGSRGTRFCHLWGSLVAQRLLHVCHLPSVARRIGFLTDGDEILCHDCATKSPPKYRNEWINLDNLAKKKWLINCNRGNWLIFVKERNNKCSSLSLFWTGLTENVNKKLEKCQFLCYLCDSLLLFGLIQLFMNKHLHFSIVFCWLTSSRDMNQQIERKTIVYFVMRVGNINFGSQRWDEIFIFAMLL